jgi:hypothetical protein
MARQMHYASLFRSRKRARVPARLLIFKKQPSWISPAKIDKVLPAINIDGKA